MHDSACYPTINSRRHIYCFKSAILIGTLLIGSLSDANAQQTSGSDPFRLELYDDQLLNGFENWSWTNTNLANDENVYEGEFALSSTMEPYGGLYLGRNEVTDIPLQGELRFNLFANDSGPVTVVLIDGNGDPSNVGVTFQTAPDEWQDMSISLEELGSVGTTTGIWWQDASGEYRERLYFDSVYLTGVFDGSPPDPLPEPAPVPTPEPDPQTGITVSVSTGSATLTRSIVDPSNNRVSDHVITFPRLINENIYGINFAPNTLREELSVPVNRWGGNATERYNFETSSSNQGRDWFFTNNAWEDGAHHAFERDNQADGTQSLLTISSMGWVSSGRDGTCSYPIDVWGEQDNVINHWLSPNTACGSGYQNGDFFGPADPFLTSVEVDESHATRWVQSMVAQHGTAAEGGVEMYAIGNEPGLWHNTHADLQATPLTRSQLIERDLRYAKAIKAGDASAQVLGPVLWGGSSYYVSPEELLSGIRPIDVPLFLEDYLSAMRNAGESEGTRLLDKLAVNFYDERVYGGGSDSLRLQSTRHLWDSTYAPEDWWVVRDFLYGNGSAVIPRLKTLIAENYPGTPLALTEYNFGGVDDGSGALAQLDVLGIFGREGLDMATLWEPYADYVTTPEDEFSNRPVFWAFRMYRNYDGAGSRFGNLALLTNSTDESTVSSFAAQREDGATTIMLINKSLTEQRISISGVSGSADVYRYEGSNPQAIAKVNDVFLGSELVALPARSASLFIVR